METAFNTFTQHQQVKMQEKMAQRQADIAASNRKAAHARGVEQEGQLRSQQRRAIGAQRAAQAQSGVFGVSAFEALEESMINAEMDVLNVRTQALQQGSNFLEQQQMALYKKKQLGQQARQILVKGGIQGVNEIIAGMAGVSKPGSGGSGNTPIAPQGQGSTTGWANPDIGR